MNKKDVSLFLTGVTGKLFCDSFSEFHKWTEERLGRSIRFKLSFLGDSIHKEIRNTITDAEWQEIVEFFMNVEESEVEEK
jgi:hypothetical protein